MLYVSTDRRLRAGALAFLAAVAASLNVSTARVASAAPEIKTAVPSSVRLEAGGAAVSVTLGGVGLTTVSRAMVLHAGKATADVTAQLAGRGGDSSRAVTLQATAAAALGRRYLLLLLEDQTPFRAPVIIEVVARSVPALGGGLGPMAPPSQPQPALTPPRLRLTTCTFAPADPKEAEPIRITIVFRNSGTLPARFPANSTIWQAKIGSLGWMGRGALAGFTLGGGESATQDLLIASGGLAAGNYTASVRLDPQNALGILHVAGPAAPASPEVPSSEVPLTVKPRPAPPVELVNFGLFHADAAGYDAINSYLLALAMHYAYDDTVPGASYYDFSRRFGDLFDTYGMDGNYEVIEGSWFLRDTQAVLMSNSQSLILAFRGTEMRRSAASSASDFCTDAALLFMTDLGPFGHVHRGFYGALKETRTADGALLYDVLKAKVKSRLAGRKLWITGHSLGGGLATLCAYFFSIAGIPVQGVYTYGSPRVGDEAFKTEFNRRFAAHPLQRWVDDRDLICMLPDNIVLGYRHVGQSDNIAWNGSAATIRANSSETVALGDIGHHDTMLYCQRLFDTLPTLVDRTKLPAPPKDYVNPSLVPTRTEPPSRVPGEKSRPQQPPR